MCSSVKYGLFDRLHVHPAQVVSLRESNKIQADLFEAFVGGLYLDQGLNAVEAWLVPLFDPLASDAYTSVREEYTIKPVPPGPSPARAGRVVHSLSAPSTPTRTTAGHLALFNQHLQRGNPTVEWAYSSPDGVGTSTTPVWEAAVIVNGEEYGRGRGNTKQNAKNEAAKVGLKRFDRRNQETYVLPLVDLAWIYMLTIVVQNPGAYVTCSDPSEMKPVVRRSISLGCGDVMQK